MRPPPYPRYPPTPRWFLLDVGEQPGLNRGGRALLLRMIAGETAGLEDYGTQLGNAAATLQ